MEQIWSKYGANMEQIWSKDGAKMEQRWSKYGANMEQRWSKDGAKMEQRWSKDGAKMEQRFKSLSLFEFQDRFPTTGGLPFIPSEPQEGQWLPLSKMRPWKFMQSCPCGFPSMYRLQLYRIPHRRYAFSQGEVRLGQGLLYRVFCQRQQEGYNLYVTKPQT